MTFGESMKTSKMAGVAVVPGVVLPVMSLLAATILTVTGAVRATNGAGGGRAFATPEDAVAALQTATTTADTNALKEILGPASVDLLNPDRIQATNELATFSAALARASHLMQAADNLVILEVGDDLWPFPVPIVRRESGWFFDTEVGKEELLNRRIGKNELAILPVMREYVEAQREYSRSDHDGDEIPEYAQRLVSSPGREDGLYWPPDLNGTLSPLGPLVALSQVKGYSPELRPEHEAERGPYHGYYFKILTRQGKHASGGKHGYVINGNMIAGFALIAWPADYGTSGIMTFIVNQQGRVFQKDLGPQTGRLASRMDTFDPDSGWELSPD